MQHFTNLKVWQRAHALGIRLYKVVAPIGDADLRSQIRRSAASAHANIAEGAKRASPRDYARFLNQASASLAEVDAHLKLAVAVELLDPSLVEELNDEIDQISRMLAALRRKVLGQGKES